MRDGIPEPERRLAVVIIVVGTAMTVLDGTIANVALPTFARELRVDAAASVWIVNAYQLCVAMLLIPLSSLGDVIGYRKLYTAGIAIFTLGSLACALSPTLAVLIGARIVQGIGGAAVMSIAPALNRSIFPANKLGIAVGISAFTVALSSATGPTLGGALLAIAPWPWLFAINVPLGLFDTVMAPRALPHGTGRGGRFDVPSALLSGPALALIVVALDGFARRLPLAVIALLFVTGAGLGTAFVLRQRRLADPMLPLELFAIPRFSLAAATSICSFTAQGIAFVVLPFLIQGAYGFTPFGAALLFTPWPAAIAVVAPIAGRLADRLPAPLLSTIGLGIFGGGLAFYARLPDHATAAAIVASGLVCGTGFGMFQAPNNRELMGSAPRDRSGAASGMLATMRTTGQSLGAAIVAALLGMSAVKAFGMHAALIGEAHRALWLASGVAILATIVSATRLRAAVIGRKV